MTFRELYETEKRKPTPGRAFILKIAKATCREPQTVRMWLQGVQVPNDTAKRRIAEILKEDVNELFPPFQPKKKR